MITSQPSAVVCTDLYEAYKFAVKISSYGKPQKTEDGDITNESVNPCYITVNNPSDMRGIEDLRRCCPYGDGYLDQYIKDFCDGVPEDDERPMDFEYTYHDRLFKYSQAIGGDINQIGNIIVKLKANPQSRRAVAVTWKPWCDMASRDPPCLDMMQFWIRDKYLNLSTIWRSRDMLKGFPANVLAIHQLHCNVATIIGVKVGRYFDYQNIPHAYLPKDSCYITDIGERMTRIDEERRMRRKEYGVNDHRND